MSSAAIYAHRFDVANDEATGRIGGGEPGLPASWGFRAGVVRAWEEALFAAAVASTRRVALRAAVVMGRGSRRHLRHPSPSRAMGSRRNGG